MRKLVVLATLAGVIAVPAIPATASPSPVAPALAPPSAPNAPASDVEPLAKAHAHNDYEHDRPLYDALAHGFTSVEADIYLIDGALLVGHDLEDLDPARTLQRLYLNPLRKEVLAGRGAVYEGHRGQLFQLLVDIKNTGEETYAELDEVLSKRKYRFMFTRYANDQVRDRAVTVVVSGDRPRSVMEAQEKRFAFYDGRINDTTDINPGENPELAPLVSDNWTSLFTWTGVGPMPAEDEAKLDAIVQEAHAVGQRVRFWATPDEPSPERTAVWSELVEADVDHINTDDLAALEDFLRD